jgi:hypothetical protein
MPDDSEDLMDGTQKRVAEMRRLTSETSRLLGETKKAEEELAAPTEHIQIRLSQEKSAG